MIKKLYFRFVYAFKGITYATLHDKSFQTQVVGGLVVLPIFIYFFSPLSQTEYLFLALGWTSVLITELQNSSFEEALDRLHPDTHESIGKSKDMAAGAVLISGLFFLFILVSIALF